MNLYDLPLPIGPLWSRYFNRTGPLPEHIGATAYVALYSAEAAALLGNMLPTYGTLQESGSLPVEQRAQLGRDVLIACMMAEDLQQQLASNIEKAVQPLTAACVPFLPEHTEARRLPNTCSHLLALELGARAKVIAEKMVRGQLVSEDREPHITLAELPKLTDCIVREAATAADRLNATAADRLNAPALTLEAMIDRLTKPLPESLVEKLAKMLPQRTNGRRQRKTTGRPSRDEKPSAAKVLAALLLHHGYDEGSVTNYEPATNRGLADKYRVGPNALTRFLQDKFHKEDDPFAKYKVICHNKAIGTHLMLWNGDVAERYAELQGDEEQESTRKHGQRRGGSTPGSRRHEDD